MKFCWCTLRVRDLDASLRFYQEIVGLPFNRRYTSGMGKEIAFLGTGETQVELVADGTESAEAKGLGVSLGFQVDSLDRKIDQLMAKGLTVEGPISPNPHLSFCFVRDPDGYRIQFVENR